MNKSKKKISLKNEVLTLISGKNPKWSDATEILVQDFLKNNSVVCVRDDIKNELWIYVEGIYVPQGKTYVREFLRDVLEEWYSQYLVNLVIAKIEVDTFKDQDEFFSRTNKWEIPVLNGVLHLKTRKLREYKISKDVFFSKLPVYYDSKSTCPHIDKHFVEVLKNPEDKKVIYELIGYCLFKEHFIEKAFMFVGNGRNGKGKTLEIIKSLLGAENSCCVPLISMRQESFNLHQMFGKLVNLAGDLNNTDLKETGLFKSLTARDTITAHRKFMSDLIFVSYCKNIFACNDLPKVYDISKGFWSRWVLLEFPYEFVPEKEFKSLNKEDKENKKVMDVNHIQNILSNGELSGLLNMAIDGLDRLHKLKEFSYTKGTQEIKDFWVRRSNSFMAFCLDCLEEDVNGVITKHKLRRAFSKYCKHHNVSGCSDKEIYATLQNLFGCGDDKITVGGEQKHAWLGIKQKVSSQDIHDFWGIRGGSDLPLGVKNGVKADYFKKLTQQTEQLSDNFDEDFEK